MQIQLLRADVSSLNVDALVSPPEAAGGPPPGGNLLCKFVIVAEAPTTDRPLTDDELRRVTIRALEKAEELAVGSVGIPPLRCGEKKADYDRCARAMVSGALEFRIRARSLRRVVFCLFGKGPYDAFEAALKELNR